MLLGFSWDVSWNCWIISFDFMEFVWDFAGILFWILLGFSWEYIGILFGFIGEFLGNLQSLFGILLGYSLGGILLEFSWDLFVCSAGPRASPIYTWRAQRLYMAGGHPLHIYKYFNKKCTHICTELPKYICRQKYLYNIPHNIASAEYLYKYLCRNICTKNKHVYNYLYTIFRLYK